VCFSSDFLPSGCLVALFDGLTRSDQKIRQRGDETILEKPFGLKLGG
jgi:hypothetical protein